MIEILGLACFLAGFIVALLVREVAVMARISRSQERMQRKVRYWMGETAHARIEAEQLESELATFTGRDPEPPDWPPRLSLATGEGRGVMQILDAIGVLIIFAGCFAIGVFLTSAYHERIASQHRAYEKEMAEHRSLYAALALRRRHKRGVSPEDEDNPVW